MLQTSSKADVRGTAESGEHGWDPACPKAWTRVLMMCQAVNQCTAQVFFPREGRGAFLACPNIKHTSLLPFLNVWCKSPFLFWFHLVLCCSCSSPSHPAQSACITLYFVLDVEYRACPLAFVTLASETLRFEADALEGGCNGKKHQHVFLLQGFCYCTEAQMGERARTECETSTVEEVYLMLLCLWAGAVDPAEHQRAG